MKKRNYCQKNLKQELEDMTTNERAGSVHLVMHMLLHCMYDVLVCITMQPLHDLQSPVSQKPVNTAKGFKHWFCEDFSATTIL